MYLSRIILNVSHPVVARAVGDLHALHRLVLQGFPDTDAGGAGRVLHRLERTEVRTTHPILLVQSEKVPNWAPLENLALTIEGPKLFEPTFIDGQSLRFRLRATPTKKTFFGAEAAKPGHRRVAFFEESEQRAWLERKALESGFATADFRVIPLGWQSGRAPRGGEIRHYAVDFEGTLTVTDPVVFAEALASGIGPAKGFGFGLLSVARLA